MDKRVLVTYATWAGSTTAVAESIADGLRREGIETDVRPASEVRDLDPYAAVVAGTPVHAGRPHPELADFVKRHTGRLSELPVAYFVVCMTMKEDTEENRATSEGFLRSIRERHPEVSPIDIGLFAGAIPGDKDRTGDLSFLSRFMLKATKARPEDCRDPEKAREWGTYLAARLLRDFVEKEDVRAGTPSAETRSP